MLNRKYWGEATLEQANDLLQAYNQWMCGDTWQYSVRIGEQEDSCAGYIGIETAKEEAREAALRLFEKALEEGLERAINKAA